MTIISDSATGDLQNKPLADAGLVSYRYPSQYGGFIMIGARDHSDALREAARSMTRGASSFRHLEIWDANEGAYVKATMP